ncbi:MAG: gliding motility protein GldM [Chitinophagales bacterium]
MSIPKEPRQLMINLMYLVLTALLALNVSAEILNAFNLVNTGITSSNEILTEKTNQLVASIEKTASKDQRDKTIEVLNKSKEAQQTSKDFVDYVEGLKAHIAELADGWVQEEGSDKKLKTEGEMEDVSHYMLKEGKADELKTKIEDMRTKFLAMAGPDSGIEIPLKVSAVPDGSKKEWAEYNFDRVPAIAVITILTKLQQDAKSSENAIVQFLADQIYIEDIKVDKMAAKVVAPTSYVKRGNEYIADIFVAATSKQVNPKVYLGSFTSAIQKDENGEFNIIEGTSVPLNGANEIQVVDGMGKIKETAGASERKYQGVIAVPKPNEEGAFKYYPFEGGYETFEVGEAVVSPTAMNVLYVGVDNPIKISVPGFTSDKVNASGCNIKKVKGEEYTANPTNTGGDEKINVSVNTPEGVKNYSTSFRVRRIPDPYAYVSSSKGGTLKVAEFKAASRIDAKNLDFVFQIPYSVAGFEMVYAPKSGGGVVSDYSNGPGFSNLMQDIQKKAKAGDTIVLPVVKVRMPDGTTRSVSTSFKLI